MCGIGTSNCDDGSPSKDGAAECKLTRGSVTHRSRNLSVIMAVRKRNYSLLV